MEQIVSISAADIIKRERFAKPFNDELIIIDLKGEGPQKTDFKPDIRVRFEDLSIILMCHGEIDININGTDYHFDKKMLFDISDIHVCQNLKISPDFKGYHVIISKNFLGETMRGLRLLPVSNFISRCNYPIEELSDEDAALLEEVILRLKKNMVRKNHFCQRDIVKNELRSLFLEMSNVITQKTQVQEDKIIQNKNEVIGQFIHLLNKNGQKEHSVAFYAKELCIDPKYLTRILKRINGKTTSAWIDEVIMNEARIYLRAPELTIQQIADALNFSDQSAFGKFFKKHSGVSPLNYRREQL